MITQKPKAVTLVEFQAPDSGLVQPGNCSHLGSKPDERALLPSLSLNFSAEKNKQTLCKTL